MSDEQPELASIADAVDALTNHMNVRTRYEVWDGNRNRKVRWHKHRMPSLVAQLARAKIPGEVYAEDNGGHVRRSPSSCPPARLEAINLELSLTAWAADNAWRTVRQVREDTTSNLRALVGAASLDSDTATRLLADLRRWVYRARVLAGWQRPPWRPDVPCPACDRKGIRVRLDLETAVCTDCGEVWDRTTIGVLAQHVAHWTARIVDTGAR